MIIAPHHCTATSLRAAAGVPNRQLTQPNARDATGAMADMQMQMSSQYRAEILETQRLKQDKKKGSGDQRGKPVTSLALALSLSLFLSLAPRSPLSRCWPARRLQPVRPWPRAPSLANQPPVARCARSTRSTRSTARPARTSGKSRSASRMYAATLALSSPIRTKQISTCRQQR
jgi:hypothetical protein